MTYNSSFTGAQVDAAVDDVQEAKAASATDTTAGRLLKVGDFGVGGLTADVDANAVGMPTRFARFLANGPSASLWHGLNVARTSGGLGFQIAVLDTGTPGSAGQRIAFRNFGFSSAASWQPWQELYHTGNLVGTVSESGGVPTGAVIERGSNANGEYVKFADGTMTCTRVIGLGGSLTLPTTRTDYAYPASFPIAPFVSGMAFVATSSASIIAGIQVGFSGFGTTSGANWPGVVVDDLKGSYTAQSVTLYLAAIGRWF